jgi:hypothetical protein
MPHPTSRRKAKRNTNDLIVFVLLEQFVLFIAFSLQSRPVAAL